MSLSHWYRRLFLLHAGILAAYVLAMTLVIGLRGRDLRAGELLLAAVIALLVGSLATWFVVRQQVQPLEDLFWHIRRVMSSGERPADSPTGKHEIGELRDGVEQMQQALAGQLRDAQSQSERLRSVLANMAEGVLAAAADSTVLLANESARQLLDFTTPHAIGRSLLEITRARPVIEALQQALENGRPVELEFESPGTPRRSLLLRATCLPGEPCPGVLIVLHDMTEMRRLENLRRELVANVSHELKTPLAAIRGYAETLRLGAINDAEHNLLFLRRIEEQADRLHELILDMLRLARLESGQESFEFVDVDLSQLVGNCVEQFQASAAVKQVALNAQISEGRAVVLGDREALQTLVNNLVDNGLKYTFAGGRVDCRVLPGPAAVAIEVADSGIGIAEAELTRIFERFYRVDKARSRERGGTGLGLSIVKHLAHAHGGAVSVVSEPGKGSTFRVELPHRPAGAKGRRSRGMVGVSD